MLDTEIFDVTPSELIRSHGRDAPRVMTNLIDHAIGKGRNDEALRLDRLRRAIVRSLAA
jgi:hypothetical protein